MDKKLLSIVKELQQSLKTRPAFEVLPAETLFKQKKYAALISEIKNHMGISCHLSFKRMKVIMDEKHLMLSKLPASFPLYGTREYQELSIDIFFVKRA
jgi:hypothetical protein